MSISPSQIERYHDEGYLCPIDVFSRSAADRLRSEFETLEMSVASDPDRRAMLKSKSNWVLPFFDDLSRTPAILDAVSSVLGPDILALSVDLFVKEAKTDHFISWHQDLHYWGLDSDDEVTAWLALSPATRDSGCMRFVPGSHKTIVEHKDTFAADNMLSRGQEVAVEVDESKAVFDELQPGQMSLHHGRMFHASNANRSNDRRIGISMRFVKPSMGRASDGDKFGAMLVRGEDHYGHFDLVNPPTQAFDPAAMNNWERLRKVQEAILYKGATKSS